MFLCAKTRHKEVEWEKINEKENVLCEQPKISIRFKFHTEQNKTVIWLSIIKCGVAFMQYEVYIE